MTNTTNTITPLAAEELDKLLDKLARVSRWIDKFPVPTDGATAMILHLRDVSVALGEQGALIAPARVAGQPTACTVPPPGWHCTRAAGHDGPCAAHPAATGAGELDATAKEALGDLSHVENYLEQSDAPTTIKNRAVDVRLCIKELRAAIAADRAQQAVVAPSLATAIAAIDAGEEEPDEDPPGIFTRDEVADMLECELITDSGMSTLRDGDSLKFNLEELAILVNHAADRVKKIAATPQDQGATGMPGPSIPTWKERLQDHADCRPGEAERRAMMAEIFDLRAQLARQGQGEPVAWMDPSAGCVMDAFLWQKDASNPQYKVPVYTAPPVRGAQGPVAQANETKAPCLNCGRVAGERRDECEQCPDAPSPTAPQQPVAQGGEAADIAPATSAGGQAQSDAVRRLSERLKWMLDADQFRNVEAMLGSLTKAGGVDWGLEIAALHLDKQREAHDREHAHQEWDTGAWVFDRPEQEEYSNMLDELAEEIRALKTSSTRATSAAPEQARAAVPEAAIREPISLLQYSLFEYISTGERAFEVGRKLSEWLAAAPSPTAPQQPVAQVGKQSAAARDVLVERQRQVETEGWTPEHDDAYQSLELNRAAASYISFGANEAPAIWPWPRSWWKPTNYRRNLVKAGALILAEIERIDRAATNGANEGAGEQACD